MASFQSAKLLRIDLGDRQLEALERLAARQGRSVEEFINDALRRYLLRESVATSRAPTQKVPLGVAYGFTLQ